MTLHCVECEDEEMALVAILFPQNDWEGNMGAPTRYSAEEDQIFLTSSTLAEVNEQLVAHGQEPVTGDAWQGRKRVLRAQQDGQGVGGLWDRLARLGKERVKLDEAEARIQQAKAENEQAIEKVKEELGL